jgi:glycosyltransferase involved in cell wall biosynthesis
MAGCLIDDFHCTVATIGPQGNWTEWARGIGLNPVAFGRSPHRVQSLGRFLAAIYRSLWYIRRNNIKIVYVCGFRAAVVLRLFRPLLANVKIVQGIRWNPVSPRWLDRCFRILEQFLWRGTDLYICNSKAAMKTLVDDVGVPAEKVAVIYNGIEKPPVKHSARVAGRERLVLTVANISERKGYFQYLTNVVSRLAIECPNTKFIWIGKDNLDGRLHEAVRALGLTANIDIVGYVEDPRDYYQKADLFVLPSQYGEGCPTSVIEAMAWGLPVIAFNIDGIPELVVDNQCGILIDPGDYQAMVTAISRLLRDETQMLEFGENGRKRILESFTLERSSALHSQEFLRLSSTLENP